MESPLSWIRWEKALLRGKTNGVKDGGRAALWLMLFVQAQETIGRSIGLLALLGQSYFILIEYLAVGNGISRTAVLCRTARKRTMELKRVRMAHYTHTTYSVAFFFPPFQYPSRFSQSLHGAERRIQRTAQQILFGWFQMISAMNPPSVGV